MAILQGVWKQHLRPRAFVGNGVKILLPSPPNYVTRSPGCERASTLIKNFPYVQCERLALMSTTQRITSLEKKRSCNREYFVINPPCLRCTNVGEVFYN